MIDARTPEEKANEPTSTVTYSGSKSPLEVIKEAIHAPWDYYNDIEGDQKVIKLEDFIDFVQALRDENENRVAPIAWEYSATSGYDKSTEDQLDSFDKLLAELVKTVEK